MDRKSFDQLCLRVSAHAREQTAAAERRLYEGQARVRELAERAFAKQEVGYALIQHAGGEGAAGRFPRKLFEDLRIRPEKFGRLCGFWWMAERRAGARQAAHELADALEARAEEWVIRRRYEDLYVRQLEAQRLPEKQRAAAVEELWSETTFCDVTRDARLALTVQPGRDAPPERPVFQREEPCSNRDWWRDGREPPSAEFPREGQPERERGYDDERER